MSTFAPGHVMGFSTVLPRVDIQILLFSGKSSAKGLLLHHHLVQPPLAVLSHILLLCVFLFRNGRWLIAASLRWRVERRVRRSGAMEVHGESRHSTEEHWKES
jgi:hypothetical protein